MAVDSRNAMVWLNPNVPEATNTAAPLTVMIIRVGTRVLSREVPRTREGPHTAGAMGATDPLVGELESSRKGGRASNGGRIPRKSGNRHCRFLCVEI
ncbi:MAG: hypothetical protein JXB62_19935 [Pirellulales bacterium]|nr:hypothetical protein [Pirellulales bacterium]